MSAKQKVWQGCNDCQHIKNNPDGPGQVCSLQPADEADKFSRRREAASNDSCPGYKPDPRKTEAARSLNAIAFTVGEGGLEAAKKVATAATAPDEAGAAKVNAARPKFVFIDEKDYDKLDYYRSLLQAALIDPDKPEPEPEPLLTIDGSPVLWRGGKGFVCGVAKSRKTTALTVISAILLGMDANEMGFWAKPGCRVLYIDTEQARYDTQRIPRRCADMNGKPASDLALKALNLNINSYEEIKAVMEMAVTDFAPDVVILDNWTDCVESVLDEAECKKFSRLLRTFAEQYQIATLSVIHANESDKSDKPSFRGWAKEEARKSDLTMFLIDKGNYSKAAFGRCRVKAPKSFYVCIDNNGLPYLCKDEPTHLNSAPEGGKSNNPDKYASIVAAIPPTGIDYTGLCQIVMKEKNKAEPTAKTWVRQMVECNVIKLVNGFYYANDTSTDDDKLPF